MPVVIDEAISRQSPPNDPARVAAVVSIRLPLCIFQDGSVRCGAVAARSENRSPGVPMSLNRVANVLDTDTALFRNSAIAFRCMAIGRYRCSRTGRRSRCRYSRGTSPFARRLARLGQLQLAPKVGRHRLKPNPKPSDQVG
jgi:hypothetical protein